MSGFNLPPGCSLSDIDPPDRPCEVCGYYTDECVCPECPTCKVYGEPQCYSELTQGENHGLYRNKKQVIGSLTREILELQEKIGEAQQHLAFIEDQADDWQET